MIPTDEFVMPMNFRIYVMWALGNLVFVLMAIGKSIARISRLYPWFCFLCEDIWYGATEEPARDPVPMREPGWALREYRERMAA